MIHYEPGWMAAETSTELLTLAMKWPFEQREVVVWEKRYKTPRLTCFFNNTGEPYQYSNQATPAHPWPPELAFIKSKIGIEFGTQFQHCLANFYRDGSDTVGYHRDSEHIFGEAPTIASLSCGATRKFRMRNRRTKEKLDFDLASGDLLVFSKNHVVDWEHSVPKTAKPVGPRLNLTFRSGK